MKKIEIEGTASNDTRSLNFDEIPDSSIFDETHQIRRRLMHLTPNHFHLPFSMALRAKNEVKQGIEDRPRREWRTQNNSPDLGTHGVLDTDMILCPMSPAARLAPVLD